MRKRLPCSFFALALLSVASLGLVPASRPNAPVQGAAVAPKTVDLKVDDVDVRDALRTTFKSGGVPYTVSPEVRGKVSADFRNLVLDDALSVLLRQVDAAVRVEGGVYVIVPRSQAMRYLIVEGPTQNRVIVSDREADTTPVPSEPPVVTSDQTFLYVVRQGVVHKIDKKSMKEVGKTDLSDRRIRIMY